MGGIIPVPTRTRHRFRDHAFELAVMVVFLLVGLALLYDPSLAKRSPVGRELTHLSWLWAVSYVIGCPLAIAGLLRGHSGWRAAGLALAGTGLLMQTVAALSYSWHDPRAFTYLVFAAACFLRAHAVVMFVRRGLL